MAHLIPAAGIPTPQSEHFRFFQVTPIVSKPCKRPKHHCVKAQNACQLRPSYLDVSRSVTQCPSMHHCVAAPAPRKEPEPIRGCVDLSLPDNCRLPCQRNAGKVRCQFTCFPVEETRSAIDVCQPMCSHKGDRTFTKKLIKLCPPLWSKAFCPDRMKTQGLQGLADRCQELTLGDLSVDTAMLNDPREPRLRCRYEVTGPKSETLMLCCPERRLPKETMLDYRKRKSHFRE